MQGWSKILTLSIYAMCLLDISKAATTSKLDLVTDPSLSRRCEVLLEQRKKRIRHKLKLMALSQRNLNLQKDLPPQMDNLRQKLKKNNYEIDLELGLIRQKIQREDEDLVRTGCPGVIL
jgi:hypothetical protein